MCLSSQDKFDCTSTTPISVRQTISPICLSFHPSLALLTVPSAPSFCLSVCPAVCPALAVLTAPRSHAVAVFCSVMATGATPALSQPMDRQPFFLTRFFLKFSSLSKVYFTHSLTCCSSQSLFFCHLSQSPSSSIADHLVAGEQRERERLREADRKHTIPWRALLRKSASQAQSVFPLLSMSPHAVPAPRLHACLQWCTLRNGDASN